MTMNGTTQNRQFVWRAPGTAPETSSPHSGRNNGASRRTLRDRDVGAYWTHRTPATSNESLHRVRLGRAALVFNSKRKKNPKSKPAAIAKGVKNGASETHPTQPPRGSCHPAWRD